MPNIGTFPDTHLLDTLLYFAPNCCQVVHVEPQYDYSPLLPLASRPLPLPPPPPPWPPLLLFAVMPLPPHLEDPLSLFDVLSGFQEDAEFATNFNFIGTDCGADFTFKDAFDFNSIDSGVFEYDNKSCEFSVESVWWQRQCNRRKHQKNCVFLQGER